MGMLESYTYEQTLLLTTNRIMGADLYWATRMRRDAAHKGTSVGPQLYVVKSDVRVCLCV